MEVDALGDEVEESEPVAHPGHRSRSALGEMADFHATCSFFFSFPWMLEGILDGDDLLNFDGIFLFWYDIFNGTMMGLIGLL